jgi:hypothetical protein
MSPWEIRLEYFVSVERMSFLVPRFSSHGPWRRLWAQANGANIRVVPELGMLLMSVAEMALLGVVNVGRRRKTIT